MKKLIIILFFNSLYSQKNIEVNYKVNFIINENDNVIVKKYTNIAKENEENLNFTLLANNNYAKFYFDFKSIGLNKNLKIALAIAGFQNQDIYQDNKLKQQIKNSPNDPRKFKENEFLIISNIFSDWELVNETKNISGYLCYKANGIIKTNNETKPTETIQAWYCPDINYSFGPLGFGGLPGLIFHLQIGNTNYFLNKIDFKDEIQEIIIPNSGLKVSQEEFDKILFERSQKYIKQ
ncbi:MAG: GLPGLI family protein [Flavobacterium sp.]